MSHICKTRSRRCGVWRGQCRPCEWVRAVPLIGALVLAAVPVRGADDPAARALQEQQLHRQQQQEALQLRMQQQQRAVQSAPAGVGQQQSVGETEIEQRQQQHELHYRQGVAPPTASPDDDPGTRRARAQIEQEQARRQSEEQLRRFDAESRRQADKRRKEPGRGEITPAPASP